jgi:hypothetical protein
MASNVIDASMSTLMMDNVSNANNSCVWLNQFATILANNAMSKYGYATAFDSCNLNEVVSIKTEDTDLFGISQKVNIVSSEKAKSFLTYLDTTDNGNRVEVLNKMMRECNPKQRIVVSVLCNLKKLTDEQISSPSNSYITMDYFERDEDKHGEECPCC